MYNPSHFREERLDVLHQTIIQARLCSLVTLGSDGLDASHIPVLLEAGEGPNGTLYGHLARGNSQWKQTDKDVEALAIFLGADAYVSPSWYPAKAEHGKVVPTWNFVTVHARGSIEFFDDRDRLLPLVTKLTNKHEGKRTAPWAVSDAPADFIDGHLKALIGFRLPIARIEGKWKLSQNRSEADQRGVVAGLRASTDPADRTIADLMDKRS
ncbi:FMN-binding negative transcriptional regulator [Dongia rigui]|uniref:FMN-binding negative transcriptional regulator n=1 Tax=Dongia rigui TaxID=940149 RepID=A0ABU5E0C1_9PROT|nr:FMN-binding negative transcriptional regulator [Dongia rigui]MDY0872934.1 FMN-binding negative transcriptional regulator [Dongia rigui]